MLFRALEIPTGEATTMDDDLKKEFFHTVEGNSVDKLQEFVNQHGSLDHIFRQVFGTASEFTTFQELTEMMVNEQFDLMELQALFVVQRLFDEYELDLDPFHANLIKEIWIVKSNENL